MKKKKKRGYEDKQREREREREREGGRERKLADVKPPAGQFIPLLTSVGFIIIPTQHSELMLGTFEALPHVLYVDCISFYTVTMAIVHSHATSTCHCAHCSLLSMSTLGL